MVWAAYWKCGPHVQMEWRFGPLDKEIPERVAVPMGAHSSIFMHLLKMHNDAERQPSPREVNGKAEVPLWFVTFCSTLIGLFLNYSTLTV